MPSLYARLNNQNMAYLTDLAAAAHLTKSAAINLIVTEARAKGWSITVDQARVTMPRRRSGDA